MNKLFILSGASGAGKSTLLNSLVQKGYCSTIKKYSSRKKFNTIDDVCSVKNIYSPEIKCDILYTMYGNVYGFSSYDIQEQLNLKNIILITNDTNTIAKMKQMFPNRVVVVCIVSDINKRDLRKIFLKRYGIPSFNKRKTRLLSQVNKSKQFLDDNQDALFVKCIDKIETLIDDTVLECEEFKLRLESLKNQSELCQTNSIDYDHIILNLYSNNISPTHATKRALEQLIKIVNKETEGKNE